MSKIVVAIAAGILCVGCGEKVKQMKESAEAMENLAKSSEQVQEATDEATKFQQERRAKGDTVAMEYKELQKYLPDAPSGYKPEGGPSGNQQNMGGFSMSTADQTFVTEGDQPSRIHVSLVDYGGGEASWGMLGPMLAMNMSSEDDHHRASSVKFDVPYTAGWEEFNKDSKDAKITAGTRYRYFITIEATNQKDDQSGMVKDMAENVAKKLDGK
jgi:hypothetical protein